MVHIRFTKNLSRLFPDLDAVDVDAATVAEAVRALDALYPRMSSYLIDERGALRKHVNIFVGEEPVKDRNALSDPVDGDTEVFIAQALSGG